MRGLYGFPVMAHPLAYGLMAYGLLGGYDMAREPREKSPPYVRPDGPSELPPPDRLTKRQRRRLKGKGF